ncbi:type II toxin-antitoxin system RelE/ParE family toxin [Arenimonas aestuarii]
MMPPWTVLFSDDVAQWLKDLDKDSFKRVMSAIEALKAQGPQLGTPLVKPIVTSTHSNMKELRIVNGSQNFRILFAFDLKRRAILLAAGDKAKIGWTEFYDRFIPIADRLFSEHQSEIESQIKRDTPKKTGSPKKKGKKQ